MRSISVCILALVSWSCVAVETNPLGTNLDSKKESTSSESASQESGEGSEPVSSGDPDPGAPIKVLTYNQWMLPFNLSPNRAERAVAFCKILRTQEWDLILMQEMWTDHVKAYSDCGYTLTVEKNDKNGLAILSLPKYEVLETKYLAFKKNGSLRHLTDGEWKVKKGMLAVKFKLKDRDESFWVINTHFVAWYADDQGYFNQRKNQVTELKGWVAELKGPRILGGDLNLAPGVNSKDPEGWQHFVESFPEFSQIKYDEQTIETYSDKSDFIDLSEGKIDHIFFTEEFKPVPGSGRLRFDSPVEITVKDKAVSSYLSDHFGWEIELYLPWR